LGLVSLEKALKLAGEATMDLVEISPNAQPPVCKIMDMGKEHFEQNKRASELRRKQRQASSNKVKEIRFRPGTDVGDYQVKLRNLLKFLEQGNKVKVTIRFRGREMAFQDQGTTLLAKIREDVVDYGVIDQMPSFEGRQMVMMISPQKSKAINKVENNRDNASE
jgi:translation initiation factor IF-3